MVEYSLNKPVSGHEMLMRGIAHDMAAGIELGNTERLIAMSGAAIDARSAYGPGPAEMRLSPPELPENVKGALASYMA